MHKKKKTAKPAQRRFGAISVHMGKRGISGDIVKEVSEKDRRGMPDLCG